MINESPSAFKRMLFITIVCAIGLLLFITSAKAQTRTPWQMNVADGPKITGDTAEHYGDSTEFKLEVIPSVNDTLWKPAPRGDLVEYAMASPFCHIGPDSTWSCRKWVDYTYFQTFVTFPSNMVLTKFTLRFRGIDDGVKLSVFNSTYPNGITVPHSYTRLGDGGQTLDLRNFANPCEQNRFVVTHVDDCCGWAALDSAYIVMEGQVTNNSIVTVTSTPVTCGAGNSNGTATAHPSGTGPFTYYWNTVPPQTTATATGLAAGTYICTVTPAVGCATAASVTLIQGNLGVHINHPSSINVNTCAYGANANIILGYPNVAQQITLQSTVSGGTPAFTYSWSGVGSQFLSSKNVRNPIFNPAAQTGECKRYVLVLKVTDSQGCIGFDTVEIKVVKATISGNSGCGNSSQNRRILICHTSNRNCSNGNSSSQTLSISINSLSSHGFGNNGNSNSCNNSNSNHYDCVGSCNPQCSSALRNAAEESISYLIEEEKNTGEIFPNPNNGNFNLVLEAEENAHLSISVFNLYGKLITSQKVEGMQNGSAAIEMNLDKSTTPSGIYFISIKAGDADPVTKKFNIIRD